MRRKRNNSKRLSGTRTTERTFDILQVASKKTLKHQKQFLHWAGKFLSFRLCLLFDNLRQNSAQKKTISAQKEHCLALPSTLSLRKITQISSARANQSCTRATSPCHAPSRSPHTKDFASRSQHSTSFAPASSDQINRSCLVLQQHRSEPPAFVTENSSARSNHLRSRSRARSPLAFVQRTPSLHVSILR